MQAIKILRILNDFPNFHINSCSRLHKIQGEIIPNTTEIVLIPTRSTPAQYPGLFLFTSAARMVRPCIHLASGKIELIGTFEQVYLDICIQPKEIYKGLLLYSFQKNSIDSP